ncbi:MAG: cation:proton antiporter [Candidatus Omnitrophica bacterium]|nr:cation:proton antiporter [Candidatus Omnitrophota bacterium]
MHYLNEQNIFLFLVQLAILLALTRSLGEVFRRCKQPPLTAELLVGIMLGPTILGRLLPQWHRLVFPVDPIQQNMLETVAWIGVLFLLLETGLEVDFSAAWRQRGDALTIALWDIIIPMAVAFIPCFLLPAHYLVDPDHRLIFSLFMATAMTISAMPIAARALHDLKLSKTDLGFLIMSALSVNDIIGWLLFTVVLGFFTQSHISISTVTVIIGASIGFAFLCLTLGRAFANSVIFKIKEKQMPQPGTSLTFICLLGLVCGAITQKIGIHALFGFFIAGVMAGGARELSERTRQIIAQMVYALFVPVFFAGIGLKIDFLRNFDVFLIVLISVIGILGRFFGAWFGTGFTSISKENRIPIAIAHTPGGAMEIVVGMLALEYNLITEPVFVAIVFGAVISSVIMGPWLNYSIKKRKEVSVLEYFSRRDVIHLRSSSRDKAIGELCELAAEHEDMPGLDVLYSAVLDRENTMGTALEEGIAVPHSRLPNIKRPVIVFGRSFSGIDWNSPDGKPARLVFLILTPQDEDMTQLQILRFIAVTMSDPGKRKRLLEAHESGEIWDELRKIFTPHFIVKEKKKE